MDAKLEGSKGARVLKDGTMPWMADSSAKMQTFFARQCYGDVLVVGLGLGHFHKAALCNPDVISVTTVEINQGFIDIMKLEDPDLMSDPRLTVICADFYDWQTVMKYDTIFGDIWCNSADKDAWLKFRLRASTMLKEGGIVTGYTTENMNLFIQAERMGHCLILRSASNG